MFNKTRADDGQILTDTRTGRRFAVRGKAAFDRPIDNGLLVRSTRITNMPSKSIRIPAAEKSRAQLLAKVAGLPPSAFIPTAHAAAYLGSSAGVMSNWRSQRTGPRYHGKNDFVRYRISDLDM